MYRLATRTAKSLLVTTKQKLHSCKCWLHSSSQFGKDYIVLSEEVDSAIAEKRPLVALESTIITHGMPYPDNLQTAKQVEEIVRSNGAVPATIAVLKGKVHIGLTTKELESLSSLKYPAIKTSRRDLPVVLGKELYGGMTVSGTMIAAHKVGIPIFVTGGIGGVHRGAESSMDVSADLTELGRTPVCVVSAGVKSILDIGRTLEYLETQGVCVATYGENKQFPAFFTPNSGFDAPHNVNNPLDAARLINANLSFDLGSGMVLAVPIPASTFHIGEEIESKIQQALKEAESQGVKGKEVTPFILRRVNELTAGKSLLANIELIKNNADVGSKIAVELSRLQNGDKDPARSRRSRKNTSKKSHRRPVVIGGSIVDFVTKIEAETFKKDGGTYPGSIKRSYGGVARNTADGLARLGNDPFLISAVGRDDAGDLILDYCSELMDTSAIIQHEDQSTATYCAVLEKSGKLAFGIGDMNIHRSLTTELVSGKFESDISESSIVFMDGNIPLSTMDYIHQICQQNNIPVWFEPTDIHKAGKAFRKTTNGTWKHLTYVSPNLKELLVIHATITGQQIPDLSGGMVKTKEEDFEDILMRIGPVLDVVPFVFVTIGSNGLVVCRRTEMDHPVPVRGKLLQERNGLTIVHYNPCTEEQRPDNIVSVSGAGDSLNAGIISSILKGHELDLAVKTGLFAAYHSLSSHYTIAPSVNAETLSPENVNRWAPWKPTMIHSQDKRILL
ncbi:uncharacterized protein LOC141909812 [Tubulanus polymorphus]|uniref:uncharacterized protein LOC141909812 n=1 Tax=Tubulanus polymorphus TaxID=672921 RepID=UPI003DA4F24E